MNLSSKFTKAFIKANRALDARVAAAEQANKAADEKAEAKRLAAAQAKASAPKVFKPEEIVARAARRAAARAEWAKNKQEQAEAQEKWDLEMERKRIESRTRKLSPAELNEIDEAQAEEEYEAEANRDFPSQYRLRLITEQRDERRKRFEQGEGRLALAMALHPRLGKDSPLSELADFMPILALALY